MQNAVGNGHGGQHLSSEHLGGSDKRTPSLRLAWAEKQTQPKVQWCVCVLKRERETCPPTLLTWVPAQGLQSEGSVVPAGSAARPAWPGDW